MCFSVCHINNTLTAHFSIKKEMENKQQSLKPIKVLELFKGTGSVGNSARIVFPNCEIASVDIDAKLEPTICIDVLEWNYQSAYKPCHFDILWASPPCTEFSIMKQGFPRDLVKADVIVRNRCDWTAFRLVSQL